MHMTKRLLPIVVLGASVALAATLGSTMVRAQSYPTKNITVIIPFAGGSASDVVARILFDRMSKNMGQPLIVENRPGAGGNSGTGAAAKATPDGYTLVGGGSGPVAAKGSASSGRYKPIRPNFRISRNRISRPSASARASRTYGSS